MCTNMSVFIKKISLKYILLSNGLTTFYFCLFMLYRINESLNKGGGQSYSYFVILLRNLLRFGDY
jgi:hypothetical protein